MRYISKGILAVMLTAVFSLSALTSVFADTKDERAVFSWTKDSPYHNTPDSRQKEDNSGVYIKAVSGTLPGRGFYVSVDYSGENGVYSTEWFHINDDRAYVIQSDVPGGGKGKRVTIKTWYPSEWGYNWGDVTVDWSPDYTPSGAAELYLPILNAPADSTADQIVATARGYVGQVPYVYGGTTASGWDCSGFVCRIYGFYGYDLWPWRTTIKNSTLGLFTPLADYNSITSVCRKGDILVFSGHVGIYSGEGTVIHALNTKYGTVETPATQVWVGTPLQGYLRIPGIQ